MRHEDTLHQLKDIMFEELEPMVKSRNISAHNLEMIVHITNIIKNAEKISMYEKQYSEDSYGSYRGNGSSYGNNSYNDNSYANRGEHWVRGHYSRDDGYSRDALKRDIGEMMNSGNISSRARDALETAMREI